MKYFLVHATARKRAAEACYTAPDGSEVTIKDMTRTSLQNEKFHAICTDLEKSRFCWAGKPRTKAQWKVLIVSGHAVATKEEVEIIPGLEHEFINIRESTALMSKKRGSSLIEYALAFCDGHGIHVNDGEDYGEKPEIEDDPTERPVNMIGQI